MPPPTPNASGGVLSVADVSLFGADGHVLSDSERAVLRRREGKCQLCGVVRTHQRSKSIFMRIGLALSPLTDIDRGSYKGRCLRCTNGGLMGVKEVLGEAITEEDRKAERRRTRNVKPSPRNCDDVAVGAIAPEGDGSAVSFRSRGSSQSGRSSEHQRSSIAQILPGEGIGDHYCGSNEFGVVVGRENGMGEHHCADFGDVEDDDDDSAAAVLPLPFVDPQSSIADTLLALGGPFSSPSRKPPSARQPRQGLISPTGMVIKSSSYSSRPADDRAQTHHLTATGECPEEGTSSRHGPPALREPSDLKHQRRPRLLRYDRDRAANATGAAIRPRVRHDDVISASANANAVARASLRSSDPAPPRQSSRHFRADPSLPRGSRRSPADSGGAGVAKVYAARLPPARERQKQRQGQGQRRPVDRSVRSLDSLEPWPSGGVGVSGPQGQKLGHVRHHSDPSVLQNSEDGHRVAYVVSDHQGDRQKRGTSWSVETLEAGVAGEPRADTRGRSESSHPKTAASSYLTDASVVMENNHPEEELIEVSIAVPHAPSVSSGSWAARISGPVDLDLIDENYHDEKEVGGTSLGERWPPAMADNEYSSAGRSHTEEERSPSHRKQDDPVQIWKSTALSACDGGRGAPSRHKR